MKHVSVRWSYPYSYTGVRSEVGCDILRGETATAHQTIVHKYSTVKHDPLFPIRT